ncbi:MAG: hypothetical protein QXV32_05605 [Conexivisphaerales archaeon]
MARTNVAVEETVAYMLADEAARQNKTLYAFTNELLKTSLRICREGGNLNEIYPAWRFSKMTREVDTVPLPGDLLEKMISRLSTLDEGWLLKTWQEEGVRIGTYLHMYEPTFERLSALVKEMEFLLPIKRLDILRVERQDGGRYIVRAIGAGLSPSSTKCAEALLQGLLNTYAMTVVSSRVSEGIIELVVEVMQKEEGEAKPTDQP